MRDSTYIGVYTNGDLDCQNGIRIDRNKPGYEFVVFTGPFLEGIPNGTIYVYSKETNGNVYVDGVQYEKGVEKKVSTVRKMLGLYIPQEQNKEDEQ